MNWGAPEGAVAADAGGELNSTETAATIRALADNANGILLKIPPFEWILRAFICSPSPWRPGCRPVTIVARNARVGAASAAPTHSHSMLVLLVNCCPTTQKPRMVMSKTVL
jgi:hypothetical protein